MAVLVVFQARKFWRRVERPRSAGVRRLPAARGRRRPRLRAWTSTCPSMCAASSPQDYPRLPPLSSCSSPRDDPAPRRAANRAGPLRRGSAGRPHRRRPPRPRTPGRRCTTSSPPSASSKSTTTDAEVWVFGDSDAAPRPALGADPRRAARPPRPRRRDHRLPLALPPAPRPTPPNPAGSSPAVINSGVATHARARRPHPGLGAGPWPSAPTSPDKHDLVGHLTGALSDDYQMTRMCRTTGQRVYFVHRCLVRLARRHVHARAVALRPGGSTPSPASTTRSCTGRRSASPPSTSCQASPPPPASSPV